MPEISTSIRKHLDSLPAYSPIEPFEVLSSRLGRAPQEIIKLDANENPYGPSPAAIAALASMPFPHIYPDPESRALRKALQEFTGTPQEHLLAGAGADELIDLIIRVCVEPGDTVLSYPPTFGMYAFDTRLNGGQIIEIPRRADFSLDIPSIIRAVEVHKPRLLFLASPNNPDGSIPPASAIDALLELGTILVLDEAYIEFSDGGRLGDVTTRIRQVPERENLVVLRTFSKWAGLAGLRVGYGAFPAWMLPVLWKAKQPYNVNVAASTAAVASLQDIDRLADTVTRLQNERQRLSSALSRFKWLHLYPTQSNFILCKVDQVPASDLKANLATRYGILVRYFNTPALQDHIRISVGRPQDSDALVAALQELEHGQNFS